MKDRLAQLGTLARLKREQRTRQRVEPEVRLRRLLDHARARSPHYRRTLAGLDGAPLAELPVLTKADLVERFDEIVTDPAVRRAEVEAFVRSAPEGGRFAGRYRVATSSGSTGRPGIVVFDADEWAGLIAAAAASRRVAGPPPGPRSAKIGSPSPWHLSAQVGATLQDPRRPTLRLPVTTPVPEVVAALDRFRPDVLTAYPSILAVLADEALTHPPGQVFAGGEVLTGATRRRVTEAWGTEPFDQYVTTEAGMVAAECRAHAGLHVLDDHVVVEVVDEHHRPVPPGTFGAAVLVTVLSSRTLPLVRYELGDRACLADGPCPCGRPGPRIASLAGRGRDVLRLPGAGGSDVVVHPAVLTTVLDTAAVAGWQVHQEPGRLRVLVTGGRPPFDPAALRADLLAAVAEVGVTAVDVEVAPVDRIPRSEAGKAAAFVVHEDGS